MAVIYITEADNTQHKFRLPAEEGAVVTIGRNEDCLIPMPGITGLSGLHCSISLVEGVYVITDEGSSNGTMDGSRAISSEALREGVAYGIGSAYLYFESESAQAAPAEGAPVEETLAEPIPVSEYAGYEAPVTAEEAPAQEAPAAAPAKKKKKRKPSALNQAALKMASQKRQAQAMSAINYVYVLVVLALAFYGGMSLRHWMVTGEFLPHAESAPAKAEKK